MAEPMRALADARRAAGVTAPTPRRLMPVVRRQSPRAVLARAHLDGMARSRPREPRAKDESPPSLFGQVADLVGALPAGAVSMVGDLATDAVAPLRIPYDYVRGDLTDEVDRYMPFLSSMGSSVKRTGGRLTDAAASLAPGGLKPSESQYAEASREGSIVGAVLEDLGNAALVGTVASGGATVAAGRAGNAARGLGSKAAAAEAAGDTAAAGASRAAAARATQRAASLDRAATVLRTASSLGDQGAALPAKVFEVPARALARKAGPLVARTLEKPAAQRAVSSFVGALEAAEVGPVSRQFRKLVRDEAEQPSARLIGDVAKASQRAERLLPDLDEQAALTLVAQGEAVPLRRLRELPNEVQSQVIGRIFPDADVSPRAVQIATDYAEGRLPAEATQRLTEALEVTREAIREPRQAREVAGFGRRSPLNPEQLGNEPLSQVVEAKSSPVEAKLVDATRTAEQARARAVQAAEKVPTVRGRDASQRAAGDARTLDRQARSAEARRDKLAARVDRVQAETASSVEAAPARYRPSMVAAQRAQEALREMAASADPVTRATFEGVAAEMPTTLEALVAAGVDPEHLIGGRSRVAQRARQGETLPSTGRLASERQRKGTTTGRTVKAQAEREAEQIRRAVANEVAGKIGETFGTTPAQLGIDGTGRAVVDAMAEEGLVPWDPSSPFERVSTDRVTVETVFVPQVLTGQYSKHFADPGLAERIARVVIDKPTRAWKSAVLAFVPRWHVGNIVGNSLMATLGAGLTPLELVRSIGEARRMLKEGGEGVPRELFGKGLFSDELGYMRGEASTPRGPLGRLNARSYELNQFVDDLTRSAIYVAKKAKGFTDEGAVREALVAAGDFSSMTRFEQQWIRRVIPFWSWQRHITQLALRLPIEHPMRIAWTLHLADQFAPEGGETPLTRGAIPLGGDRWLRVGALNPFGDVLEGSPLLSLGGLQRAAGPIFQVGAAALQGTSLRRGGAQLTRPPGSADLDAYGRPTATPLIGRPGELAQFAARQLPQVRLFEDLTEGPVIRYETGDPMHSGGRPIPSGASEGGLVARYMGVPTSEVIDERDIVRRRRQRELKAAADRRRYSA